MTREEKLWNYGIKPGDDFDDVYELVSETVEHNGRFARATYWKKGKQSDKFKDFKVNDFAIDNLMAVGAVDGLKPVKLSGNAFDNLASINAAIDWLDTVSVEEPVVESEVKE